MRAFARYVPRATALRGLAAAHLNTPPRSFLAAGAPPRLFLSINQNTNNQNHSRQFTTTPITMGVTKTTISEGSGPSPQVGQTVVMEYTGWLKDPSAENSRGKQFDTSVGRGDFATRIGVGQVIKGWDEGVTQMKLGEKAILDITSDYGYGDRGFPGAIPPKSDLIFQVELKQIK